jgi:hypothetical protein
MMIENTAISPEPANTSYVLDFLGRHPRFGAALSVVGVLALSACGPTDGTPAASEASISSPAPSPNHEPADDPETVRFPEHTVTATVFSIGEEASADNAYITNTETAWDSHATDTFGGFDDPENRNPDGLPAGFTPKHNPYYFALPADEYDENGVITVDTPDGPRTSQELSPWADEQIGDDESLFKGRWIEVRRGDRTVFAQWVDCGPSDDPDGTRDYGYVFGPSDAVPANQFGLKAGLDLSPSASFLLGFGIEEGGEKVTWRFVGKNEVPDGPWTRFTPIDNKTHWD